MLNLLMLYTLLLSIITTITYAWAPVSNQYVGLLAGGSGANGLTFETTNPINNYSGQSKISYSILGNIAAQWGYRKDHVRIEGEFLFNNNSYSHLSINGINIPSNNSSRSISVQLRNIKVPPLPFTFNGYTNTYAGLVNGFYDFFNSNDDHRIVPYLGGGLGYTYIQDKLEFFKSGTLISNRLNYQQSAAGQGIIGIGYFITDYTAFNIDFRYFSTLNGPTTRTLYSLNFLFNTTFNL